MAEEIIIPKKKVRGDDGCKVISVRMKEELVGELTGRYMLQEG